MFYILLKLRLTIYILATKTQKNTKGCIFYKPLIFVSHFCICNSEGASNFEFVRFWSDSKEGFLLE